METLTNILTVTLPSWFAAAFQWIVDAFEGLSLRLQIEAIQALEGFVVGLDVAGLAQNIEAGINNFGPTTLWLAGQLKVPEMMTIMTSALAARIVFVAVRAVL